MNAKKPWRKKLYENQEYPDNYTDASFLDELKKNINKQDISYWDAVCGAGRVTEQLCAVVIFCIIFVYLDNKWVNPDTVFVQSSLFASTGYILYLFKYTKETYQHVSEDSKTVVVFLFFGYVLSPILKTLSDSISTDTIYATTTFMMIIHLIFFDYKVSAAIVSSSLSLNAAIFGSVCLASRLSTSFHAFVLLTVSVECFVLYPILIYKIHSQCVCLMFVFLTTTFSLYTVSSLMTALFVIVVFVVNIVFPNLFIRWQSCKDNIYGPWDEAIVKDIVM